VLHKNYYLILGVSRTESQRGVRQAFRTLVRHYHPERMGPRGLRFFSEILEAYHVLADPARRQWYDQGLAHAEGYMPAPPMQFPPPNTQPLPPQVVTPLRYRLATHTAFTAALARIAQRWESDSGFEGRRWEGIDVHVILPPEDAARGGTLWVSIPSYRPCQVCGGSGQEELFPCPACQGEGFLGESEAILITIPAQVGDGTRVEVPLPGLGVHGFYLRAHIRIAV
jgi:hypothetical protein